MVRSVVPDAAATRRPADLAAAHAAVLEARALDASVLIRGGGTKLRRTPARTAASGNRRQRVGFVTGCIQEVFFGDVNAATVQVLVAQGCEVVAPRVQGCCGALELHGGREAAALRRARRLVDVFSGLDLDAIAVNAAGCCSALKDYGRLLADDPADAARAAEFAAKVCDVTEILAALPPQRPYRRQTSWAAARRRRWRRPAPT